MNVKRFLLIALLLSLAALWFLSALHPSSAPIVSAAPKPIPEATVPTYDTTSAIRTARLPTVLNANPDPCASIPGESYISFNVTPPPASPVAEQNPDLNLALRGYERTNEYAGLVDYFNSPDPNAPQLVGLTPHLPKAGTMYQVYSWNWTTMTRGGLITDWPVTLAGLVVTPSETIHVPNSGYTIGGGYMVLVLYASRQRITLKYTNNDSVASGYTIHVEGVCVEPNLLALYNQDNLAGRAQLPALQAGQSFGRAIGSEIRVAIRDTGAFMDPRSKRDWWQGF